MRAEGKTTQRANTNPVSEVHNARAKKSKRLERVRLERMQPDERLGVAAKVGTAFLFDNSQSALTFSQLQCANNPASQHTILFLTKCWPAKQLVHCCYALNRFTTTTKTHAITVLARGMLTGDPKIKRGEGEVHP
jgi:hypothetical protein